MGNKKTTILIFIVLVLAAAVYRAWEGRPFGFAPQIAMALFAGSVVKDKKFAFLVPLLSMLVSDLIYQILYTYNLTDLKGFYQGQWVNYVLFTAITFIGFLVNKNKVVHIILGSLAGVLFFFFASNFFDWRGGGLDITGQPYPKTFDGLMECLSAGVPFLKGSIYATFLFNAIFFGGYYLYNRYALKPQQQF